MALKSKIQKLQHNLEGIHNPNSGDGGGGDGSSGDVSKK